MKSTIAHLHLPPQWNGEPPEIERDYPARTFEFDTADRAASGLRHRALFVAVGTARKQNRCGWFRCACRDDDELELMVRLREPSPYLAVMPGTSLRRDPDCAFHHVPVKSHMSDAVTQQDDGSLRVRLNFRIGLPVPEPEKYQTYLAKRRKSNGDLISKAYQNSLLWTLNDFYTLLHQRGKVLINPCAELPPLRKPRRLPRGVVTAAQVTRLLQAPDVKKPFGFRDRAMLELLYSSGLRGVEVCNLSLYDIDFDKRLVRIVQGKGRKDRLVLAGRTTLNYVAKYIEQVRPIHAARNRKGQGLTRLFLTVYGTPFNTKYL